MSIFVWPTLQYNNYIFISEVIHNLIIPFFNWSGIFLPIFLVLVGAMMAFSCDDNEVFGSLAGTAGGTFFVGDCGLFGRPGRIGGPGFIGCGSRTTPLPFVESGIRGLLQLLGPESAGVLVLSGPVGDKESGMSSLGGGKVSGDGLVGEYPFGLGKVGGGCFVGKEGGFFLITLNFISSLFMESLNISCAL